MIKPFALYNNLYKYKIFFINKYAFLFISIIIIYLKLFKMQYFTKIFFSIYFYFTFYNYFKYYNMLQCIQFSPNQ